MSEVAYERLITRGEEFAHRHVEAPYDYVVYQSEELESWTQGIENGGAVAPLWLRRNGESSSFGLAAAVDFVMPSEKGVLCYATINVDGVSGGEAEVEVWLPKSDGSGDPVVASREPYDFDSLERAVQFAEDSVSSRIE